MKKVFYILVSLAVIIILLLIFGKKHISTEIMLNVPINKVWIELTDFSKYPDWNPFIRKVKGEIKEGNVIEVIFQLHGSDPFVFTPEIKLIKENDIFQWEGKLYLPGIFTGRHTFQFIKIETNKTKLIQQEDFNGILVPFFSFDSTIEGFNLMNKEFKKRTENKFTISKKLK
jgi:hypothetical protein